MIIGEAPGYWESQQGFPFVGKSGLVLQRALDEIGTRSQDIYVTNVVKHRPPNNRDPRLEELDACWPALQKQIKLVAPKVIVCVGKVAARNLAGRSGINLPSSGLRGRQFIYQDIPVRITWHPAYVMPGRTPEKYPEFVADLASALEYARNKE